MRRIIVVAALLGFCATACGHSSSNQSLARLNQVGFISDAAAQSQHAGSAKLEISMKITGGDGDQPFAVKGDGVIDFTNKLFAMTTQMPSSLGFSGTAKMIMTPDAEYALLPPEMSKEMGGKAGKWIRTTKAEMGGDGQADPTGLSSFTDPAGLFEAIKSYASSVKEVGSATVRGVGTTEYLVTLDKSKINANLKGRDKSAFDSMPVPQMSVFVGDDRLIRREALSFSDDTGGLTMTIDLFDYGTPVHIAIPPASDVVDFKSIPTPIPS